MEENPTMMKDKKEDDYYMDFIKENFPNFPIEEETVNLLAFFLVFSCGCRGLKLNELADKFDERASSFVAFLNKLDYKRGHQNIDDFFHDKDLNFLEKVVRLTSKRRVYIRF